MNAPPPTPGSQQPSPDPRAANAAQPSPAHGVPKPVARPASGAAASPSILHSLGAFVGHIAKAIRTDPVAGERIASRSSVQEQRVAAPNADITLRRTVKDEVFVKPVAAARNTAAGANAGAASDAAAPPGRPITPPAASDLRPADKNEKM